MQQLPPPVAGDPSELDALYQRLRADAGQQGFYERLDDQHTVQFTDGSDTLLVGFEHMGALMGAQRDHQSLPRRVQARTGCAQLSLLTSDDTWFRAEAVYAFFDDLVDDGFFDQFSRVVFFGAGPEGYAAAAYSVVASDAQVLLIQPQATLTPRAAGWDRRFPHTRRMDFTQRYGYAPNMIDTAGAVVVVFDPAYDEDFMHAQLFDRDWVDILRARHLGPEGGAALDHLGLLDQMLDRAVTDGLTAASVAATLRTRRLSPDYLHAVMDLAEASGRDRLVARVQGFARRHCDDGRFALTAGTTPGALQNDADLSQTDSAGRTARPSAALAALAVGGALTRHEARPLSADQAIVTLGGVDEAADLPAETPAASAAEPDLGSKEQQAVASTDTPPDAGPNGAQKTEPGFGPNSGPPTGSASTPDTIPADMPPPMAQQPWTPAGPTALTPPAPEPVPTPLADQTHPPVENLVAAQSDPMAPALFHPAQDQMDNLDAPYSGAAQSDGLQSDGSLSDGAQLYAPQTVGGQNVAQNDVAHSTGSENAAPGNPVPDQTPPAPKAPEMVAMPSQPWDSYALAQGRAPQDSPDLCDDPCEDDATAPNQNAQAPAFVAPAPTTAAPYDPARLNGTATPHLAQPAPNPNPATDTNLDTNSGPSAGPETGPETRAVPSPAPIASDTGPRAFATPNPGPIVNMAAPTPDPIPDPIPDLAQATAPVAAETSEAAHDTAEPTVAQAPTDAAAEPPAPSLLDRLRADIQRRRGHAPVSAKTRRPAKRKL